MKKMIIFDPAMCCSTGVCGPSVNPELLRVSTVINRLEINGVLVKRYNLTSNVQMFVDSKEINKLLNEKGVEVLPVTMVDGVVVKTKTYPTNKEFCEFLDIPQNYLKTTIKKPSKGCNCKGGCC
ncbi:arsenite efflux transporter metallochaperone ArsD [Clostridium rectalis]|uniref:arsenite efflux transporter metallochaperone ArsD n=1 Tax=Clostridium rectalis TaxID=2040295 RepID=UPI000F6326A0|nr:arsenite efflux transporter metallochaperone ArsD [Clostridium rectalis]